MCSQERKNIKYRPGKTHWQLGSQSNPHYTPGRKLNNVLSDTSWIPMLRPWSVLPSTLAREVNLCSGQQGRRRLGTGQSAEKKYQSLSPQWDIYPNPLPTGNLRRGGGENVETRGWIGVLWHTVFRTGHNMPTAPTDSFQLYSPAREQVNEIRWPLTGSINRLSGLSTKKEKQRKREKKERKREERTRKGSRACWGYLDGVEGGVRSSSRELRLHTTKINCLHVWKCLRINKGYSIKNKN